MLPDFPDPQAPSQSLKAPFVVACLLHLCLVGCLGWFMSQSPLQNPIPLVSIELSASLIEGSPLSGNSGAKAPDASPQPPQTADIQQKKQAQPKQNGQTDLDLATLNQTSLNQTAQGETGQGQQEQTKLVKGPVPQTNKTSVDKSLQSKPIPQEPLKKSAPTQAKAQATTQAPTEAIHQGATPSSAPLSGSSAISDSAPMSISESQTGSSGSSNSTSSSKSNIAPKVKSRAEKGYLASIVQKLHRSLRYPESAREKRISGTTTVQFTVNLKGQVSGERIHTPSGHPELDKEALALIKRAAPFKPIPSSLGHETMTLTVPIRFSLK